MRGTPPPRQRGGGCVGGALLLLHRHQLPQGHGTGTCSAWDRHCPALPGHEDLLSMGTATWCGSPGHWPHRRFCSPL